MGDLSRMVRLLDIAWLWSGGAGSGCHGPNCGRPMSPREKAEFYSKQFQKLKKQEITEAGKQWIQQQIKKTGQTNLKVTRRWWKKELKRQQSLKSPAPKVEIQIKKPVTKQKWLEKNAPKLGRGPAPFIKSEPVSRRQIQKQFTTSTGAKVMIIKPPGQKEKTGKSWLMKVSPYKGSFVQNLEMKVHFDDKQRFALYSVRDAVKDRSVAVQIIRNFGEKAVTVKEMDLVGVANFIARSREVRFNNMGQSYGFLNRRYGITLKLKGLSV